MTTAAPDAVSFAVSGTAVYGDHITVRIGSASGLHEIAVHETGSGTPLGAYTVTPSVPATTALVPLSFVPHSNNLTITITALGSTPGALDTITFYLPRDTTVPTNIASNVCTGGGYRYGYNGKMKDNEWAGEGNNYDYGARHYDPRIIRWFSNDPLVKQYPSISSYAYALNTPICAFDPDGMRVEFGSTKARELYDRVYKSADPETRAKFDILQNSDVEYYIQTLVSLSNGGEGQTVYNFQRKRIDIEIKYHEKHKNPVGALGDELETASQFENGDIGYYQSPNNEVRSIGYDMEDEVATKRAEIAAINAVSKMEGKNIPLDNTTIAFQKADTDPIPQGMNRAGMIEYYFATDPSASTYIGSFAQKGRKMGVHIPGNGGLTKENFDKFMQDGSMKRYIYRENKNGKNTSVTGSK